MSDPLIRQSGRHGKSGRNAKSGRPHQTSRVRHSGRTRRQLRPVRGRMAALIGVAVVALGIGIVDVAITGPSQPGAFRVADGVSIPPANSSASDRKSVV